MAPVSLRIVAPASSDTSDVPTVLLQCDAKRYLFNAGEGTTRISAQHRSSNARVEQIFLTRVASDTMGGIPGLLMTLADGGRAQVAVHGPRNLKYALATTRFYARRDTMEVHVHESPLEAAALCYEDEHIRVQAVPLVPHSYELPPPPSQTPSRGLDLTQQPWRDASWRPSSLTGADAEAWYDAVVADSWKRSAATSSTGPSRSPRELPAPSLPSWGSGPQSGRQAPVLTYVVEGAAQRGKFDADKAASLGIPPGPAFARLTRGESVRIQRPVAWGTMGAAERAQWLRPKRPPKRKAGAPESVPPEPPVDTEEVHIDSSDVVGPSRAGTVFFYVHVPTDEHLTALVSHAAFRPYQAAAQTDVEPRLQRTPYVMVHATPPALWNDARYVEWRASFGPGCHHLVSNRAMCTDGLSYTSSALTLLRLSFIDPTVFRVPGYRLAPEQMVSDALPVQANLAVNLQPRSEPALLPGVAPVFDRPIEEMAPLAALTGEAAPVWDAYLAMAREARSLPPVPPPTPEAGLADDVAFVTLGTGSSAPSKHRNVLSTLVCTPKDGYILLDAGESTYFQLARRFGPGEHGWHGEGVDAVLRKLKLLFVSHIHGDHHMGVARLLLERRKLGVSAPLFLVTNNYTRYYLREYDRIESLGLRDGSVVALDNEALDWRRGLDPDPRAMASPPAPRHHASQNALRELYEQLRLDSLRTVPVVHRASHCYGVVLRHRDGWSCVFSGDTMPCAALAEAGQNATVLIHEATMQDEELELARAKGHSTVGDALHMAQQMNAAHVLLTHFSQRYPKLARLGAAHAEATCAVGIAFDMARLTPADMRRLGPAHAAMALLLESEQATEESAEAPAEEPMQPGASAAPSAPREPLAAAPPPQRDTPAASTDVRDAAQSERQALAAATASRSRSETHVDFDYRYVALDFVSASAAHAPSDLSVRQGLAQALQELHGVVGGAVHLDVLYAGPPVHAAPPHVIGEAVVRVDSNMADTLLSVAAGLSGSALMTITGQQPSVRVQVRRCTHHPALLASDSRAWIKTL